MKNNTWKQSLSLISRCSQSYINTLIFCPYSHNVYPKFSVYPDNTIEHPTISLTTHQPHYTPHHYYQPITRLNPHCTINHHPNYKLQLSYNHKYHVTTDLWPTLVCIAFIVKFIPNHFNMFFGFLKWSMFRINIQLFKCFYFISN